MLQNLPVPVEDQKALIAAADVDPRRSVRIGAETAGRDAVGVVQNRFVVGPKRLSQMAPQGVPDHKLLLAVAIHVEGERIMASLPFALPLQLQILVEHPEPAITILDHYVLRVLAA